MVDVSLEAPERGASPAVEFMTAFNDIEAFLRQQLRARNSDSFKAMVGWAERDHLITSAHHVALDAFSDLRNSITHGSYRDGRAIADPRPDVIAEIQAIRGLLLDPPVAMTVLEQQQVRTLRPGDSVNAALEIIRSTSISQIPIYEGRTFVALLTTNTIARWVAADLAADDRIDAQTITDMLRYAEASDNCDFLPRTATALEVIDQLTGPALPWSVIITETGEQHQRPLRVISGHDVGTLLDSVA